MYSEAFKSHITDELAAINRAGFFKRERILTSPQHARILVKDTGPVVNFCSNNYLGLASHPEVIEAARIGLERWGYGLSSVRFICGTQEIHKELEFKLSEFLGTEDTILYASCFDANGGLFETILSADDAIISDALNHASIIDGIRLCKARRLRYANNDMADLEVKLKDAACSRHRLIATDGVFSMDGTIASLEEICDLAEKHESLVMVDDSHAVGFVGRHGRGTHEHHRSAARVDLITGTLGKALGGGSGGYVSGRKDIIEMLRQRSRPYLFSNSVTPSVLCASLKAIEILQRSDSLRVRLMENTKFVRAALKAKGFKIIESEHPIIALMLGDAGLASRMADRILDYGIYVVGFSYPVVPAGEARIRIQISAAHNREDLERLIQALERVRSEVSLD